jgi:hypothetical protein
MIIYKPLFSGWKEVTKEQAINIAKHLFNGGLANCNKKIDYINSRFEGIKFKKTNDRIEVEEC